MLLCTFLFFFLLLFHLLFSTVWSVCLFSVCVCVSVYLSGRLFFFYGTVQNGSTLPQKEKDSQPTGQRDVFQSRLHGGETTTTKKKKKKARHAAVAAAAVYDLDLYRKETSPSPILFFSLTGSLLR